MDTSVGVKFDGNQGLSFTQGEDRLVLVTVFDIPSNLPINLTGGQAGINFPLQGGGSVKRLTSGPIVNTSGVVLPAGQNGYIHLPDHGLITGDPIQVAVIGGGVLPTPLAPATPYLIQTIDKDNFYFTDTTGAIVSLTDQGSGSFTITNSTDLQIPAGDLGEIMLNLRALVSAQINAALAQPFQVEITLAGKTRIVPIVGHLDVTAQPVP